MADEPVTDPVVRPKRQRKPLTIAKAKERSAKLLREAARLRKQDGTPERRCKAIMKSGNRCGQYAIKGGFVCRIHGGSAPQVRASANKRLLAMVEPSLIRLEALIQQDEHMPTALGAIRTVLERAGSAAPIGPLVKEATGEKDTRPIINIGIKVGGIDKPIVSVGMLPAAVSVDPEPTDGEITDEDEDDQ